MKLSVKVKPKAREDRVLRLGEGRYKVWVKAAPERGRANEAVIEVLSEHLNLPKSRFSVVSGSAFSQKVIEIRD
ncbi:MAG: DUF167 domain-containing protein [Candidatus Omnitrophica bacterium]|nr:DUF167 domain-containing protein [Candidatus Omnitrophota bacterium]